MDDGFDCYFFYNTIIPNVTRPLTSQHLHFNSGTILLQTTVCCSMSLCCCVNVILEQWIFCALSFKKIIEARLWEFDEVNWPSSPAFQVRTGIHQFHFYSFSGRLAACDLNFSGSEGRSRSICYPPDIKQGDVATNKQHICEIILSIQPRRSITGPVKLLSVLYLKALFQSVYLFNCDTEILRGHYGCKHFVMLRMATAAETN